MNIEQWGEKRECKLEKEYVETRFRITNGQLFQKNWKSIAFSLSLSPSFSRTGRRLNSIELRDETISLDLGDDVWSSGRLALASPS